MTVNGRDPGVARCEAGSDPLSAATGIWDYQ
ncbi:hypothetical protein EES45_32260 [Streptomyces sp. ADI97-07]|nr:hypothetical protein EES45_32260 [Streptomyces sp. ADI97-07]